MPREVGYALILSICPERSQWQCLFNTLVFIVVSSIIYQWFNAGTKVIKLQLDLIVGLMFTESFIQKDVSTIISSWSSTVTEENNSRRVAVTQRSLYFFKTNIYELEINNEITWRV